MFRERIASFPSPWRTRHRDSRLRPCSQIWQRSLLKTISATCAVKRPNQTALHPSPIQLSEKIGSRIPARQCNAPCEAFALCHFLPTGTPRFAPAALRQVRKVHADAQFSERREDVAAALRREPGASRAAAAGSQFHGGGGRSDDRRGLSRSPTGPTSDRPDVPLASN